jgi:hypothetical protein
MLSAVVYINIILGMEEKGQEKVTKCWNIGSKYEYANVNHSTLPVRQKWQLLCSTIH